MEAVIRTHREKTRHGVFLASAGDHGRKVRVGERVAVVGQEHVVVGEQVPYGA